MKGSIPNIRGWGDAVSVWKLQCKVCQCGCSSAHSVSVWMLEDKLFQYGMDVAVNSVRLDAVG